MLRFVYLISGLLLCTGLRGQDVVEAELSRGFIIAPAERVRNLEAYTNSYSLIYTRKSRGKSPWESSYLFPEQGYRLTYLDLGNPELSGHSYIFMPELKFNFKGYGYNNIKFEIGAGLAYFDHIYDQHKNYKNKSISSPVAAAVNIQLNYEFIWGRYFTGGLSLALLHLSAGSFKVPNYGYNIPNIGVHIGYILNRKSDIPQLDTAKASIFQRKNFLTISPFASTKADGNFGEYRFYVEGISVGWERHYRAKSSFSVSTDFAYDPQIPGAWLLMLHPIQPFSRKIQFGERIGYTQHIGQLNLMASTGVYLYNPATDKKLIYSQIGGSYTANRKFDIAMLLKTHLTQADYIFLQLIYRIQLNK